MKTIANRILAVLLVILLIFSLLTIIIVKAQEELPTIKIDLISPTNTTYSQNTILLNFSIQKQSYDNMDYTIDYSMQGENFQKQGTFFMGTPITNELSFNKNFKELQDGTYALTVSAKYVDRIMWVYADRQIVTFTINTKTPQIRILSNEKKDCITNYPLKFTINKPTTEIFYNLDNLFNNTIPANYTLTGLPTGTHNITVYAKDLAGNLGVSETVYFNIKDPFPIISVTATIAIIVLVGIGMLAYSMKKKKSRDNIKRNNAN